MLNGAKHMLFDIWVSCLYKLLAKGPGVAIIILKII